MYELMVSRNFRDLYDRMQDGKLGEYINFQIPNSDILLSFLFLSHEDCIIIINPLTGKHFGSIHFHPDECKVNAFYGGNGMDIFESITMYHIDDPDDMKKYINKLQLYL